MYFITSNKNKFKEVKKIAKTYGFNVEMLDLSPIEVQSETLEEVAKIKLESVLEKVGQKTIVFCEDSGLFIRSLNDFPGVYSSYVFKKIGNLGILKLLEGVNSRDAYFKAVVSAYIPKIGIKQFVGITKGKIDTAIRGDKGFGFDPIFIPHGYDKTFAELGEEKNKISHRAKAFNKFFSFLKQQFSEDL